MPYGAFTTSERKFASEAFRACCAERSAALKAQIAKATSTNSARWTR